jgi:hypothetical protein
MKKKQIKNYNPTEGLSQLNIMHTFTLIFLSYIFSLLILNHMTFMLNLWS